MSAASCWKVCFKQFDDQHTARRAMTSSVGLSTYVVQEPCFLLCLLYCVKQSRHARGAGTSPLANVDGRLPLAAKNQVSGNNS
eukprot:6462358-Amphidinium_carterae.2